jgi:hypothetical protein
VAPKNTIDDLRTHLFDTLQALKRDKDPMDIPRAQAIANVANAIIESAKVEVAFLKTTGALKSTDFLPSDADADALALASPAKSARDQEEADRLRRIHAARPPAKRINGQEFDTVWDGAQGRQGASLSSR